MTLLSMNDVRITYGTGRRRSEVVHGVDLSIQAGETLGLVGESGSGKTTLGRSILGLVGTSSGTIEAAGHRIHNRMTKQERRALARDVQVVFQDPYTSLNPSLTIADTLAEPLIAQGVPRAKAKASAADLLKRVDLPADAGSRLPREFSGGQRQRIAIARALALEPKLIICDEPVSALDLTTQSVVLDLLIDVQRTTQVGYLFISHDLAVIRHISHRVAVMYRGDIIEQGATDQITTQPARQYTQRLLLASPVANPSAQAQRREAWLQVRTATGSVPTAQGGLA